MRHVIGTVVAFAAGISCSYIFLGPLQKTSESTAWVLAVLVVVLGFYAPYHAARGEAQGRIYMRGWVYADSQPPKFKHALFMCYVWSAIMFAGLGSIWQFLMKS